jgi:acyl-CoA thioester hydrolase
MSGREVDGRRLRAECYPHRREIPARFADMDLQRHINNVAIASFYEDGRATLNMRLFGEDLFARKGDFRFVVLETRIRYLSEAPYPADYVVGAAITRLGNSSAEYGMGLFHDGTCVGLCDTVLVHMTDAGPTRIPDARRAVMGEYALRDAAE